MPNPESPQLTTASFEVASIGNLVISRVLPLTSTELDFRASKLSWELDNRDDITPDLQQSHQASIKRLAAEASLYKSEMATTEPIIVPAKLVIVRDVESRAFQIRERKLHVEPASSYTTSTFNLKTGDRGQSIEIKRPEKKYWVIRTTGYSNEFAVASFKSDDLLSAISDSKGFFWNKERLSLFEAVLKRRIEIDEKRGNFIRPRIRPFRVTPQDRGTNGYTYVPNGRNRWQRKVDLVWNANYWQTD